MRHRRYDNFTTTVEVGIRTRDDGTHWQYAQRETRVIVSSDADFVERNAVDIGHAGIVFFRKDQRSIGDVVEWLMLVHGTMTPEDMRGHLEFVPVRK